MAILTSIKMAKKNSARRPRRRETLAPEAAIRQGRPQRIDPAREEARMPAYNILTFGAAYGSLLAVKLLFGGHKITMVCLPNEVEAFNKDGARVRLPIRGRKEQVELNSRNLPGSLK